jgi:diadenosine tetraphosphate (Ap4A) HIT family hydrolase
MSDKINQIFTECKSGIVCPMCPDSVEADVVAALPSGKVHLQNDADYRGYCILICRRHAVEIHDLTPEERAQWIEDMARIGQAITAVCRPAKLNVSLLGNMVPHLHCHFMPRYPDDPEWGHPPAFRSPTDRKRLSEAEFASLKQALSDLLIQEP